MKKEQILALAEKCGIFPRLTPAGTDEVWGTKRDVESFFNAAIESYKAELLKEVGEPVGYVFKDDATRNFYNSRIGSANEYGNYAQPLYTSDQVAAAILKATKPLEDQLAALKAENETAWAQANRLALELQKTPLSSANGGTLG